VRDGTYVDRPAAYAIIHADQDRLAFVRGKGGRLYLPGGVSEGRLTNPEQPYGSR
jgi:hypothetical protein